MNEQERTDLQRFSALDSRLTTLETNFAVFTQEMKDFKQEMKDFKNEMRQQNEMRAKENAELRNLMKEIYTTTDAKFAKINEATDAKISKIESKLDSITSHIQILTMTAMGGIIAAGVGLAAMVYSVLNK